MSASLRLRALRGDDSLGFLAALGLVSLSEQGEISPLRLGWEGRGSPVAVVEGPSSVDALGEELTSAFKQLKKSGSVLPGVDSDFPRPSAGTGPDAMRMNREALSAIYRRFDDAWLKQGTRWPAFWLEGITAQAVEKQAGQRGKEYRFVELTPFYAPTGQMKLRSSVFEFAMDGVSKVSGPADALTSWRRLRGYSAANYDNRALRDGTVSTNGETENEGAPSPTWLAAMAIRLFSIVDDGRSATTSRWLSQALYPDYTNRSLVWPVWRQTLDPSAVRALLSHPALNVLERGRYEVAAARPGDLEALGVVALFGASRRTLTQGDGPLGPTRRIWPSG